MKTRAFVLAAIVFTALFTQNISTAATAPAPAPVYLFGVVPQQAVVELAKDWTPILIYLSNKTGYSLRFASAKDIPTFESRVAEGEYDIAYMNPYHYSVFHRAPGYKAFAKEEGRLLKGVIVVKKTSAYSDLQALKGETVAFSGPAAFAASILTQGEFGKLGIAIVPKYVASHDSVYLSVARGVFAAGGGVAKTLDDTSPEIKDQLRVLWSSVGFTPHPFAAHPRVPSDLVEKVQRAMIAMAGEPEGAALLKAIGFKGIVVAADKDYDDVRRLRIKVIDSPAK